MRHTAIATAVLTGILLTGCAGTSDQADSDATAKTTATASAPVEAPAPPVDPPAPAPEPAAPELTIDQENAVGSARDYLAYTGFSRSGLVTQLEYEGYDTATATFAADHVAVDWNAEAAESAKAYLDLSSFSRQGLLDQLAYEGYTPEQAEAGVVAAGY